MVSLVLFGLLYNRRREVRLSGRVCCNAVLVLDLKTHQINIIKGTDDVLVCLKRDSSNTFEHDDVQMNGQTRSFVCGEKKINSIETDYFEKNL